MEGHTEIIKEEKNEKQWHRLVGYSQLQYQEADRMEGTGNCKGGWEC